MQSAANARNIKDVQSAFVPTGLTTAKTRSAALGLGRNVGLVWNWIAQRLEQHCLTWRLYWVQEIRRIVSKRRDVRHSSLHRTSH